MADLNEAFNLQSINNIENPHILNSSSFFEDGNDYTLGVNKDLEHNNMQPFFRKKNYGTDYKQTMETFQQKTDLFTGSKKQVDWHSKKEVKSLFKPAEYNSYVYGRPNQNELFKSRYIPSMQRNGEKPFQEIRVQPGLNLGMNEESNIGFHDPFRAMPKNVDQLRTANKPKVSYDQPTIPGLKGSMGPNKSKVNKNKPEKFKALGTYNIVPTGASFSMPSIIGRYNPMNISKTNNRGAIKTNIQATGAYMPTNQKIVNSKCTMPKKENYLQDTPTNLSGNKTNQIYNLSQPDLTNRNLYNYSDVSNLMDYNGGSYVYDVEGFTPDPTNRDIYKSKEETNIGGFNNSKSYVYDSNNLTPDPTKRDIFKSKESGNISNDQKSYIYDLSGLIPESTQRDIYKIKESGNITNDQKSYMYDLAGLIPDATKRDIFKIKDSGNFSASELGKSYIYDTEGLIPDPTKRDIFKTNENGNISNDQKSYIYNLEGLTPDVTQRDIFKISDQGNISDSQRSYIFDKNGLTPNITRRDIFKIKDSGNIANSQRSYAYDKNGLTPSTTQRDIYKYKDVGNIIDSQKSYVYDLKGTIPGITQRDIFKSKDSGNISSNVNNSLSYIYREAGLRPHSTNRDLFKYADLGNVKKSTDYSYIFSENGTKPVLTNRDLFKNSEIYGCANASGQYRPTTRKDVYNMTLNQRKEDLNNSYKNPQTNSKEYLQMIPSQHLKDDNLETFRFNPPIIPLSEK